MNNHYSIVLQWSEEDQTFVVSLPEFGPYAHTHGDTYEAALEHGKQVLDLLIAEYQTAAKPLPKPLTASYWHPTFLQIEQ
ncbi:MAG TPA: type II toxin-antitoxin system HicB family antitoxin [Acidobacteriota bacterium]|nr:type II toxin-antitoxin system HicB family antitoxin [Acidobacteriota bacterium]